MIIPCIDIMNGKVVQLVQGRDKALELDDIDEMLARFHPFGQLQVIDLDAAMGLGSNDALVAHAASRSRARVGGGVRTVERACQLVDQGVYRIIVGTAAFHTAGPDLEFLSRLQNAVGAERITIALDSKEGRVVVKGWKEATNFTAEDVISQLEPFCGGFLCTYVDKEGMMQGTDLQWFANLRRATRHELIAAGGITTLEDVRALTGLQIHCAIGMAIYTGRLTLEDLAQVQTN